MMKTGLLTVKGNKEYWLTRSASGNYIVSVEESDGKEIYSFSSEEKVKDFLKNN